MYDDDYPTCAATYATLRIYPGTIDPAEITARLQVEPSSWQREEEEIQRAGPIYRRSQVAPINGWFLTSKGQVKSRDSRRHIDWVLDHIASKGEVIRTLQEEGCRMDVSCFWVSRQGHDGPTISPHQMKRLAELNIELWFDIYGDGHADEYENTGDEGP